MRKAIVDLLSAYLMGLKTIGDCAEWIAGIDWDKNMMDESTRALAGEVELWVTEVLEGLRSEAEFFIEASRLVALETNSQETNSVYFRQGSDIAIISSSNENSVFPEIIVPEVAGLQSWNISPLPVSV